MSNESLWLVGFFMASLPLAILAGVVVYVVFIVLKTSTLREFLFLLFAFVILAASIAGVAIMNHSEAALRAPPTQKGTAP